jgi:hypothetical protein
MVVIPLAGSRMSFREVWAPLPMLLVVSSPARRSLVAVEVRQRVE